MLIVFHCFFSAHNEKIDAQNTGPNVGSFGAILFFFLCFNLKIFDQNKGRPFFNMIFLLFSFIFLRPTFFLFVFDRHQDEIFVKSFLGCA